MSLVEIARFDDVTRADLAAAFLASHSIDVDVTERFQTTVEPYMQRALGIRLLAPAHLAKAALDPLRRAEAGEFAAEDGDALSRPDLVTRATGTGLALLLASVGALWGTSLPHRLRPIQRAGLIVIGLFLLIYFGGVIAHLAGVI